MHQHLFLLHLNNTICQTIFRYLLLVSCLSVGGNSFAESSGRIDSGTGSRFGDSWKEEVLLHDGRTIVVDRSQSYGGGHEIGQRPPIRDMTITFTLQSSGRRVSWFSEYGEDLGRSNFTLGALHLLNEIPYVVALPNLCQSYNKWGRPNPSYVLFTYQADAWIRIPLSELPTEFKSINLVVDTVNNSAELARLGKVSAEKVKQLNGSLTQPEYREILRERIVGSGDECPVMVSRGKKGGRVAMDWFTNQPNLEACLRFCEYKEVSPETCPCNQLFKAD